MNRRPGNRQRIRIQTWWILLAIGIAFIIALIIPPSCHVQISLGEKILITAASYPDKEAGVNAFASGKFAEARDKFESSRGTKPNDPEALIYLNNAKAAIKGNALKIATSVPIGGKLEIAEEILRGVAQAQNEVNDSGGIKGRLLQVAIANDDNEPEPAKKVAACFVKDTNILAVVGHNSSKASLAAAPVYNQNKLVMISPTSTARKLSGIGEFIFRTVPSSEVEAKKLAAYAIETARLTKIAICNDLTDIASKSITAEFTQAIKNRKLELAKHTACDFSSGFDASDAVAQAISDGAKGIFLAPEVNNIKPAVEVAEAAHGRLALLSYSVMYTDDTFNGKDNLKRMVLTTPWHPKAIPGTRFAGDAAKLWGGTVNWRSALAYDATQAIVAGLNAQSNPTRIGLQEELSKVGFSAKGATGTIEFSASGDRDLQPILTKIVSNNKPNPIYEFKPLTP